MECTFSEWSKLKYYFILFTQTPSFKELLDSEEKRGRNRRILNQVQKVKCQEVHLVQSLQHSDLTIMRAPIIYLNQRSLSLFPWIQLNRNRNRNRNFAIASQSVRTPTKGYLSPLITKFMERIYWDNLEKRVGKNQSYTYNLLILPWSLQMMILS